MRLPFILAAALIAAPVHADISKTDLLLDGHHARRTATDPMAYLRAVNRRVNNLPLTDCKAFAFEKIRRLEAYGIDARFVVVTTETGAYHAIAVVDGYALDNRRRDVTTVDQLRREGYTIAPLR